jgi:hypothetical protein
MRREAVARLRAQGLTLREIAAQLPLQDPPILHKDGTPFTHVTVLNDLIELRKQWSKAADAQIQDHVAEQLATLNEVERQAWARNDLDVVLKAVGLKMKLLGTDAPAKIDDWSQKDWREYAKSAGLNEEEVVAEAKRILATRTSGRSVDSTERDRPQNQGT